MQMEVKKNKRKIIITWLAILSMILKTLISFILFRINENKGIIIVSFGNDDKSCSVEKTELNEEKIIKQYGKYPNLKIDKVTNIQKIKSDEINKKIRFRIF